jgi:hypothetical protein
MRWIAGLVSILLFPMLSFAQAPPNQTAQQGMIWLQGFSTLKFGNDSRWSHTLESQIRRAEFGATWQQFIFRGLTLYKHSDRVSYGGGYAFVETWPYGTFPAAGKFPEQRLFEQLSLNHRSWADNHRFDQRVRLEQRWVRSVDATGQPGPYSYTNRVRYLGGVTIPLNEGADVWSLKKGDWIFYANDEIFFNFGRNVQNNTADQNRAAAGLGYYYSPNTNARVGYLYQYIQKGNGFQFESNHVLTITLTRNISFD